MLMDKTTYTKKEGANKLVIDANKLAEMQDVLDNAESCIKSILFKDNSVWVCSSEFDLDAMGEVCEQVYEIFGIDDETDDAGFVPIDNDNYMRELGGYFVERGIQKI